ncbi:MAG TPA: hypothetical protein PK812_07305 [Beijerinckiaceae bacterium]|nr:hypothetical protein [Beijerinckiaceae bacterium]
MALGTRRDFPTTRRLAAILAIASGGLLAGCAAQHQVTGVVEGGNEVFTGQAIRSPDLAGSLVVVSNRGVQCVGNYVFTEPRMGAGTFRCSDGRTGPFKFVSTGLRGTGTGRLGDKTFTFSFG